jgi:hypothetical protein
VDQDSARAVPSARHTADRCTLYAELDALEEVRKDAEKALVQEARLHEANCLILDDNFRRSIRRAQTPH